MWDDAVLEVLFGEVLDDVVAIGERLYVPPVAVSDLSIDDLDGDGALLHLEVLLVVLLILKHHLDTHGDVLLELLGNKVELDALGEGLEQLLLEVVLLLRLLLLLRLAVDQLPLLALDFLLLLGNHCLLLTDALL